MAPLSTRSSSSFPALVSLLLACGLAAVMGRHLMLSLNEEAPRVYRAEGYTKRVRAMLESPRQALALQGRELVFQEAKADANERLFFRHSQWLKRDIERFNKGLPGFFSLRHEKGKLRLELDEHAHDVPLPLPADEKTLKIDISGGQVPMLGGEDLRLVFDPPQAGLETPVRTLDASDWVPRAGAARRDHHAVSYLLRHGGMNLAMLTQPEEGRILLEPLQSQGVLIQINGTVVNRAEKEARQQQLRDRVKGHQGGGFPLVDGDRLLFTLRGGQQAALRYGLTRGGLHFDSETTRDCPLLGQAQQAVLALQGRSDITITGALPPFTMDARLQSLVENALQTEVARLNQELRKTMPDIDQHPAAITVLDAMNGEALALASYPDAATLKRWDDAARRGENTGIAPITLEALHRNQNLQRIPIGSTSKPLLAAAIWEAAPALRRLKVEGGPTTTAMYGHKIEPSMNNPSKGTSWGPVEWLEKSSNPYTLAAYLAALAPADSYTLDGRGLLQPKGGVLDLSRWLHKTQVRPEFFMQDTLPDVNIRLRDTFGISLNVPDKLYDSSVILPWIDKLGLKDKPLPHALKALTPETTHLNMQGYLALRGDIVSMVIGGGNHRWSNLKLAEGYARLGTGLKVESTLVRRATSPDFPPLPVSAETLGLIREGMTAVVMRDGTAVRLRPALEPHMKRLSTQGLRLVVHGKTGTATRDKGRECAALALYLALHDAKDNRRSALACTIYLEDRAGASNSTHAVLLGAQLAPALIAHLERQAAAAGK